MTNRDRDARLNGILYRERLSDEELDEVKTLLDRTEYDKWTSLIGVLPLVLMMWVLAICEIMAEDILSAVCLTAMAIMWLFIPIYYAGRYSVVRGLHRMIETETYFRGDRDGKERKEERDV